jgi:hypothetical protein
MSKAEISLKQLKEAYDHRVEYLNYFHDAQIQRAYSQYHTKPPHLLNPKDFPINNSTRLSHMGIGAFTNTCRFLHHDYYPNSTLYPERITRRTFDEAARDINNNHKLLLDALDKEYALNTSVYL